MNMFIRGIKVSLDLALCRDFWIKTKNMAV